MNTAGIGKTDTTSTDQLTDEERAEKAAYFRSKEYMEKQAAKYNAAVIEPKDGIFCNLCGNKQTVARVIQGWGGNWYVQDELCACVQKRNAALKLRKSGMQETVENTGEFITAEDWQRILRQKALDFVGQNKTSCFFVGGPSGTGKTHISTLICRTLLERGHAVQYRKWTEIVRELTDYRNEQRGELFKELTDIEVLYLDDMFKPNGGNPDPREVRATFEIIDRRYMQPKKITIISSELTTPDITRIDPATSRRIIEMCGGENGTLMNIGKDKTFRRVEWRYDR